MSHRKLDAYQNKVKHETVAKTRLLFEMELGVIDQNARVLLLIFLTVIRYSTILAAISKHERNCCVFVKHKGANIPL